MDLFLVAIGGALGAAGRYLISLLVVNATSSFPFGALIVNFIGSFLLGFVVSLSINDQWLLGTGVLGGFTTFSTFSVEAAILYKESISLFVVYVLLTIVGSMLLFTLAFSL
ncbi:fluoride efflux transporter FluC [Bacillus sp. Hm123]|uniref:fluoride efflux transporter FluC n=1 Tax=Bacillus sp. Hm123 TaxID=3450745 RepID=UPI003F44302F